LSLSDKHQDSSLLKPLQVLFHDYFIYEIILKIIFLGSDQANRVLIVEKKGKVGVVQINRPKALNGIEILFFFFNFRKKLILKKTQKALNSELMTEMSKVLQALDQDSEIGAIVLTGSEKAFAAGADIKEMQPLTYTDNIKNNFIGHWSDITKIKKPIIAAVSGYALGGGCELAMMCDILYASESAVFGQPEIKLGTIPGAGGTQRLVRAVGKAKAMEWCLGGAHFTAQEAEKAGLVAKVFPQDQLLPAAMKLADTIASYSQPIVMLCKEAVNKSFESSLAEGTHFERRLFHSTFATNDQKEGMKAFIEKRKPNFTNN